MKPLNCLPPICLLFRKPSKLTPTKTTILSPYTPFPPPLTPSMASQVMPEGRNATPASRPPPEQGLRCPRCDSSNTKFCYYNNYSLTQPRYFCKTCRRYWTKGGALRNVPIGGGCRKNKKSKAAASRASAVDDSDAGGLKFLHGTPSAVNFQLNGLPFSRLNSPSSNGMFSQFFTFGDLSSSMTGPSSSTPGANIDAGGAIASPPPLMGFRSYPIHSAVLRPGGMQEMGSNSMQNNIASSIESLSTINQDLHLKLQQQRLAMMFGGSQRESSAVSTGSASLIENQQNQQLPTSFQASESSKNGGCGVDTGNKMAMNDHPTGLFLESSYPTVSEMQSWSDIHQFS